MTAVVGADLAAGRGITEVVTLRRSSPGGLWTYAADIWRPVTTDADVVAAVAAACPKVVAIDAPLTLPAAVRSALMAPMESGGAVQTSPYTRMAERDPVWGRLGVRPLPVSFLGGLTFRAIALAPRLRAAVPTAVVIEVFPSATRAALRLGLASLRRSGVRKTSSEARAALQSALAQIIAGLPGPDEELYGADRLDALLAAITAACYLDDLFVAVGDPLEGQIVLPCPAATDLYKAADE